MTTPLYSVRIKIGDDDAYAPEQSWDLDRSDRETTGFPIITDGVHVLAGLKTGWSMPENALWPLQPNPMTAAFAMTLPDFEDAMWMAEGSPISIEVDLNGTLKFAFYGRLTDATAVPRSGRDGVTLSVAAVDYTVDPGEWREDVVIVNGGTEFDMLTALWDVTNLGEVPDFPLSQGEVSATNVMDVRGTIDELLLATAQEFDHAGNPEVPVSWFWGAASGVRAIFAPKIDLATGRPPTSGPRWAFDVVWKDAPAPRLEIDANRLERGALAWSRNKRTQPSTLTVNGKAPFGGDAPTWTLSTDLGGARGWGNEVAYTLDTASTEGAPLEDVDDNDRLAEIIYFFLPIRAERGWRLSSLRWHVTRDRTDDEIGDFLDSIPDDIFPRWFVNEGEPERAAYYQRRVELFNVPDDLNPYSEDDYPRIVAPLAGVQLTIQGGQIVLDLTLRHLQEVFP